MKEIPKIGEVYAPGEDPLPPGERQPFFAPGGLVVLIVLIVTIFGVALLKRWVLGLS